MANCADSGVIECGLIRVYTALQTHVPDLNFEKSKSLDTLNFGHYANMSVQYTAIIHGCKNDNFQMKIFDIFLIFAPKHRLWVHVRTASARRF